MFLHASPAVGTLLSPFSPDPATAANVSLSTCKSACNVLPNPSSRSATHAAVNIMVILAGEHTNEQTAKDNTHNERLLFYSQYEKRQIKQDLLKPLRADDVEKYSNTSGTFFNAHGKRPGPTLHYTLKFEEAR